MNFEEFLKEVTSKINPAAAFNLARDARIKALERILVEVLKVPLDKIEETNNAELKQLAESISKMPPLPK